MTDHRFLQKCTGCGQIRPETRPFRCTRCGGAYDFAEPFRFDPDGLNRGDRSIWRYAHSLLLPQGAVPVTLGEGGTPLLRAAVEGRDVFFKCEHLNPTGSFKDRGMSPILTETLALGVKEAVEDSSGNAGAAFAAYAARAGIKARVYVPASASGPKRAQIAALGASIVPVDGPRSRATDAAHRDIEATGAAYASHVYNPLALAGYATIAYEIAESLGHAPAAVIAPAGQGTLLLGVHRGFEALRRAAVLEDMPRMIGVQSLACAPLFMAQTSGAAGLQWVTEGETIAEGIRVLHPVRGDAVLGAVRSSGGTLLAYDDSAILRGREELARLGVYVEPTSAVVWPALLDALPNVEGEIVVVLTGTGFKSQ